MSPKLKQKTFNAENQKRSIETQPTYELEDEE
jgi:hypothetical protein